MVDTIFSEGVRKLYTQQTGSDVYFEIIDSKYIFDRYYIEWLERSLSEAIDAYNSNIGGVKWKEYL